MKDRPHSISNFLHAHGLHAAEIDRAFAEKAGAAFDVMTQDDVTIAKRTSKARLG